eukprot:gene5346-5582_t
MMKQVQAVKKMLHLNQPLAKYAHPDDDDDWDFDGPDMLQHLAATLRSAMNSRGKGWFELPEGRIDDSMKRDLRLLRLRGAYNPKRFYKSFDDTKFPKHFARKASMTDQLLADKELEVSRKKRFSKLQDEAQKWVKHKKRKTGLVRNTPAKHRPKH